MTIESNTTSTTGNASTGAASDENSQENKEELQADAGNSTAEEPVVVDLGTEKKLKKRTFRIPLKVCILAYCFQDFLDSIITTNQLSSNI